METATKQLSKVLRTLESMDDQQTSSGGSTVASREELKEIVKEGVKEGLEEHHRQMEESQSSGSSSHPLLRILGGAAVLAFLAYMRQKRASSSEVGTGHQQGTTIETTPDGGRKADDRSDKFAGNSR